MKHAAYGSNGKVNSVTFVYYDGALNTMDGADVRGGKVSLAGIGDWDVND